MAAPASSIAASNTNVPPNFLNVSIFPGAGVFHSSEVPFVFGTAYAGFFPLAADDLPLSAAMMGYWTRFAATGDPNGGGAPAWPLYAPAGDQNIVLDVPVSQGSGLKQAKCDFWDGIYP